MGTVTIIEQNILNTLRHKVKLHIWAPKSLYNAQEKKGKEKVWHILSFFLRTKYKTVLTVKRKKKKKGIYKRCELHNYEIP